MSEVGFKSAPSDKMATGRRVCSACVCSTPAAIQVTAGFDATPLVALCAYQRGSLRGSEMQAQHVFYFPAAGESLFTETQSSAETSPSLAQCAMQKHEQ